MAKYNKLKNKKHKMKEALEKIGSLLKDNNHNTPGDIYPSFSDKRYTPHKITQDNFNNLTPKTQDTNSNIRISSVDGGNIEIIKTPDTSIQLIRIYFNIFKGNKRQIPKNIPQKIDFYTVTTSYFNNTESDIYYKTTLIPLNKNHNEYLPKEEDLDMSSFDPTIMNGIFRAGISKMGEIARRFAEWKITESIVEKELEPGDIILRDGSLQTGITNESKYSESAYSTAEKKGVLFTGISKTSTMLATTGRSLSAEIMSIIPEKMKNTPWIYYPVADSAQPDHKAEIYYVNLNKSSRRAFRFEILKTQKDKARQAIEELANSSRDISFPGYPYSLIDADKNARVRFKEISFHRTMIEKSMKDKKAMKNILESESATDAHAVIDSIV